MERKIWAAFEGKGNNRRGIKKGKIDVYHFWNSSKACQVLRAGDTNFTRFGNPWRNASRSISRFQGIE